MEGWVGERRRRWGKEVEEGEKRKEEEEEQGEEGEEEEQGEEGEKKEHLLWLEGQHFRTYSHF